MLEILDSITFLFIVKVLLLIMFSVYGLFAMLMMRQIGAMTKAVQMQDDYVIRFLGIAHFGFAIIVWFITLFLTT